MDVAALALSIDSNPVERAIDRLDKFAASADRAHAAAQKLSGNSSTAKLGQDYERAARAADQASGSINRIADAVVRSNSAMVAANDNAGRSFANANAHVLAYQKQLAAVPAAANQAAAGIQRVTKVATDSGGAFQNNAANIAAQFQDIGVTAAMGMNPLLIALQQGTQLSAVLASSGGSAFSTIGAAIRQVLSPVALLTIGLVALIAYAAQLAVEFFNSSDKAEKLSESLSKVEFATDAVGSAQTILGGVMDLTTGKINTQSTALIALARAQLLVAKVQAQVRAQEARTALRETEEWRPGRGSVFMRQLTNPFETRAQTEDWRQSQRASGADIIANYNRGADYFGGLKNPTAEQSKLMGQLADNTIKNLERMRAAGKLSEEQFANLASNVANYAAETTQLKVWDDAQRLLDGDRSGTGYLLKPDSAGRRRGAGGKTDADRLADILRTAKEAIVAEDNRAKAVEMSAQAAAELEQRTKLLNAATAAGIKMTPALTAEIGKLAEAYAVAKVNADVSEATKKFTDDVTRQREAVADQVKLIGLYGDALARARREMDAQRNLSNSLPKGAITVTGNLTGGLSDDIEANSRAERMERTRKDASDAAYAMDLERRAIGLTGAAALEYAYISERLVEAKRAGIDLSPAEIAAINAAGAAYANQRYEVDKAAQSLADSREIARGFFFDWSSGVRETGNIFKSFADAAVSSLNRIIDKLIEAAIEQMFFNSVASSGGGGGGFLSSITSLFGFANGGAFGAAERFANGGAFTNQIVNSPTLFRFAKGTKLGEMGEAGPEAVMPLKRGPNGVLGVQASGGGKPSIRMGDVYLEIRLEGAMTPETVVAIARQAGEEAVTTIRRDFASIAAEYENNGAVVE